MTPFLHTFQIMCLHKLNKDPELGVFENLFQTLILKRQTQIRYPLRSHELQNCHHRLHLCWIEFPSLHPLFHEGSQINYQN